jgi:hypothetical protein
MLEGKLLSRYCPIELAVAENTLFALPPINRIVPTTNTKMTASMTAYSAISWPSSCNQSLRSKLIIFTPPYNSHSIPPYAGCRFTERYASLSYVTVIHWTAYARRH